MSEHVMRMKRVGNEFVFDGCAHEVVEDDAHSHDCAVFDTPSGKCSCPTTANTAAEQVKDV